MHTEARKALHATCLLSARGYSADLPEESTFPVQVSFWGRKPFDVQVVGTERRFDAELLSIVIYGFTCGAPTTGQRPAPPR